MATAGCGSDEIAGIKCCICTGQGRIRDAEKYCVSCNQYYCSSCANMHSLFAASTGHQLLDKSNSGFGASGSLPSFPTKRCSLHRGKIVDMFCQDHDEVMCATCIALSHRTCKNIRYIPDDINSLFNKQDLTRVKQKIKVSTKAMENIKQAVEEEIKQLDTSLEAAVESVKAFRQEIENMLDALEEKAVKRLKGECNKANIRLQADLDAATDIIHAMDESASKLREAEGNDVQQFVCMKSLQKLTTEAETTEKQRKKRPQTAVNFTQDKTIIMFLKKLETFGNVSFRQPFYPKADLYQGRKQIEVDVRISGDTSQCWIYGSCITEDGFLLVVDYNNKKLKRVDMSEEKIRDFLVFEAKPYAVCQTSTTEAAVTLDNQSVNIVSILDTLKIVKTLQLSHTCFGLSYVHKQLVISDEDRNVYMYDMNGRQLQRISDQKKFQSTYHIAISDAGDRVYVADRDKGLVVLDAQGNHLATVSSPAVKYFCGICTDGKNVFVCGFNSHNIIQIGTDNKVLGEVANIQSPVSLTFDHRNERLIVTNDSDKVTIIELE